MRPSASVRAALRAECGPGWARLLAACRASLGSRVGHTPRRRRAALPTCGEVAPAERPGRRGLTAIFLRMPEGGVLGLLVATRDEPGVLYRLFEATFKHCPNITYITSVAHPHNIAPLEF